jgi:hypothetical protein
MMQCIMIDYRMLYYFSFNRLLFQNFFFSKVLTRRILKRWSSKKECCEYLDVHQGLVFGLDGIVYGLEPCVIVLT